MTHLREKLNLWAWIGITLVYVFALACGGGSELASTSIGGTGTGGTSVSKASGPIDQFGSVYVGGIHFSTNTVTTLIEGVTGSVDDLELGMWVEVEGTVDSTGNTGTATNITYGAHLAGNVLMVDGNEITMGNIIIETDDYTRYGNNLIQPLMADDFIAVTGQYRSSGNFWASHIGPNPTRFERTRTRNELAPTLENGVELIYHIEVDSQIGGDIWQGDGITIDFSEATNLSNDGGSFQPRERLAVRGRRDTNGRLRVSEFNVREERPGETEVIGTITLLQDHPPRVTIGGNVYRIEPFTIFEDQSVDARRRFGFRDLNLFDSVKLVLSPTGVVMKLIKQ